MRKRLIFVAAALMLSTAVPMNAQTESQPEDSADSRVEITQSAWVCMRQKVREFDPRRQSNLYVVINRLNNCSSSLGIDRVTPEEACARNPSLTFCEARVTEADDDAPASPPTTMADLNRSNLFEFLSWAFGEQTLSSPEVVCLQRNLRRIDDHFEADDSALVFQVDAEGCRLET